MNVSHFVSWHLRGRSQRLDVTPTCPCQWVPVFAANPALAIFVRLRARGWTDVPTGAYAGE
jgi:hypothetical protein